jgi:hypothetical protein
MELVANVSLMWRMASRIGLLISPSLTPPSGCASHHQKQKSNYRLPVDTETTCSHLILMSESKPHIRPFAWDKRCSSSIIVKLQCAWHNEIILYYSVLQRHETHMDCNYVEVLVKLIWTINIIAHLKHFGQTVAMIRKLWSTSGWLIPS